MRTRLFCFFFCLFVGGEGGSTTYTCLCGSANVPNSLLVIKANLQAFVRAFAGRFPSKQVQKKPNCKVEKKPRCVKLSLASTKTYENVACVKPTKFKKYKNGTKLRRGVSPRKVWYGNVLLLVCDSGIGLSCEDTDTSDVWSVFVDR